ncbi:hypothetical protein ACUWEX_00855 [Okibacterium fritillariae]|uniref:hypothetical protein n=1 Tax=Okibacterium fritillariae TaxID=123320 RepID=UPI0040556E87
MSRSKIHTEIINDLDWALRSVRQTSRFSINALEDHEYDGWYSRLLSSLATAANGDSVQFGYGHMDEDSWTAQVVVFTEHRVIVATVVDITDEDVTSVAKVARRSAIASYAVRASEPVDRKGSSADAWPGMIELTVWYDGLPNPLTVEGNSHDWAKPEGESDLWKLYESLVKDLDKRTFV